MNTFDLSITELGNQLGVPGLSLDENGICTISFERTWSLTITHDTELGLVIFHTDLGAIPQSDLLSVQSLLLEANVLWCGTGGATFGVVPGSRRVILSFQERSEQIDTDTLLGVVESFQALAQFWMSAIRDEAGKISDSPSFEGVGELAMKV